MKATYLELDDLLAVARAALHPVQPAVRDVGLLESALARPQATAFGADAYPTLHEKAAALLESLAGNRALIDGDKRLAWVATRLFLIVNGSDARMPDASTGDRFVRDVAQGKLELAEIAATLRKWGPPQPSRGALSARLTSLDRDVVSPVQRCPDAVRTDRK